MKIEYTRGSIHYCQMPEITSVPHHSVERGYRPVVIISSLTGILRSDIMMVCPITTKIKQLSCNINIGWTKDGRQSQVLCNQIMTVPKMALTKSNGQVTDRELNEINSAILISLGIAPSTATNIQASQEALVNAKKDYELLQKLLPEDKSIMEQIKAIMQRSDIKSVKTSKRTYTKRTEEDTMALDKLANVIKWK